MWNLKYDTTEPIYETETDSQTENRLMVAKGEWGRERDGLGVWGWQMQTITFRMEKQQGPNDSAGNCIQYPMINHNGKEYRKRMPICV